MPQFNLTNHWMEFRYTVESIQHVQKFQVASTTTVPTANFIDVVLQTADGSNISMADFIQDYTAAIAGFFATPESTFDSMTLWYQPDGAIEPTFIATDAGGVIWTQPTSTAGPVLGGQTTHTFRAADGRLLKIVFLETIYAPHQRTALSVATGPAATLRDYILSAECPIQSRSGAYPLAGMNRTVVYNDKIVRKRFDVD